MSQETLPDFLQFDFFQAVRLLQNFLKQNQDNKEVNVVCQNYHDELIRFNTAATKGFPSSQVFDVREIDEGDKQLTEIELGLFGLVGPISSLPWHDTERAIKQRPFRLFLEVFNHRLTTLFYRAWEKNHYFVGFEKQRTRDNALVPGGDLTNLLYGILGFNESARKVELDVEVDALISHASVFIGQQRNRFGLIEIISAYFPGQPIRVLEFSKNVLKLDDDQCTSMGGEDSLNSQLGVGTILGSLVTEFQTKFRIRIGPLDYETFNRFLPHRKRFRQLNQLVRLCCGDELEFDFQFELAKGNVPLTKLSSDSDQFSLGQNMWLLTSNDDFGSSDPVFASLNH